MPIKFGEMFCLFYGNSVVAKSANLLISDIILQTSFYNVTRQHSCELCSRCQLSILSSALKIVSHLNWIVEPFSLLVAHRVILVVFFAFLAQKIGKVVGTYKCQSCQCVNAN